MTRPKTKAPSRLSLYGPFIAVGLLFAAYSAYWFYVRGQLETGINDWITEQRAAGAEVEYASKRVGGFPYRFALHVDAPRYASADSSMDWRGEELQIIMQPWNFSHAIFRSPGRNEIARSGGTDMTAILSSKAAASLQWDDDGLTDFGLELPDANLVLAEGSVAIDGLVANLAPVPETDFGSRLAIDWQAIRLDPALLENSNLAALGTELQASRLRLEGKGFGIFGPAPSRDTEIAQLLFNWGPLKLGAKGKFDIDAAGYPNGNLMLRLEDGEALKEALREAGLMSGEMAILMEVIIGGSRDDGFVPIPLRNGSVTYFGQALAPVPQIAPAIPAIN